MAISRAGCFIRIDAMSRVMRSPISVLASFLRTEVSTSPEQLLHAAKVSMWVRFSVYVLGLLEVQYRIEFGALSHVLNTLYVLGALGINGYVQYLVRRSGTVKPSWLLALSALDLAATSFTTSLSGGFSSPYFTLYYAAVALFAWVFASVRLTLAWTTLTALVYVSLCVWVEPGMDWAAKDERELFYRVVCLYAVAAAVSVITHFERDRRIKGLERERELQRQRIELSQAIHDTTAQWAYMIGLGLDSAMELVDDSNSALTGKLRLAGDLSKTAMWELRHAIDGGQIFRGEELGDVLDAHAATFTTITSVPAEFVRRGREPPMSTIAKSLLFSMAHNALTNVIRHADAKSVVVILDCTDDELRLSVSDDGVGLPVEYETRGHGFRNMRADAARIGGTLEVDSDGDGGGTTVMCVVPRHFLIGED